MRQILLSGRGAIVARMPRPIVEPGMVLVRVRHSLISVGTELAGMRTDTTAGPVERTRASVSVARRYVAAALRDPRRAAARALTLARHRTSAATRRGATTVLSRSQVTWTKVAAASLTEGPDAVEMVTDQSTASYQAISQPIALPAGRIPVLHVVGTVIDGPVAIGVLNSNRDSWLGVRTYQPGAVADRLIVDPAGSGAFSIVVAAGGAGRTCRLRLETLDVELVPPVVDGLPQSELEDQGWNVGYAASGAVVAVGTGVADLGPGDRVACAGAGHANHAEFISVPRNLVCRIPRGCPDDIAATATVGAIALQGVRRAEAGLGDRIAVIGLGLIGQLTVQLLNASGCAVVGLDLNPVRVARARRHGLQEGASDRTAFEHLVRDATGGHGVDAVLVTAATTSHDPVNLAMAVCRRRGRVVLVGDVGLHVERPAFYRKEIDLLMSTSYGPGRYDATYEIDGRDYPLPYVRWTLNRNLQAYLEMVATGRLDVGALIDRRIGVDDAPAAYAELAAGKADGPLAVLLEYPDDQRPLAELPEATSITVRGHRPMPAGPVGYALVGAGSFGTSMLVPQIQKRADALFLRAVVSRNTTLGGNFARSRQVEILTTELDQVLRDPRVGAIVIATRHAEHAAQVVAAVGAGKPVFVEKPLALTWEQLDAVATACGERPDVSVMVGFNRRFSPALQRLKARLADRRSPLMIGYRVNAGYLPLDHWVQGRQGGGRNLGEACHMYDVFRFLVGAPVAGIDASAIRPADAAHLRTDNFSATLSYQDGSIAHLLYTASGPAQGLGKERLEVFADGEAFVVDDFARLVQASDGDVLWSGEIDKGHAAEISAWADSLQAGGQAPIPLAELLEVTAVALSIEDALHGRIASEPS